MNVRIGGIEELSFIDTDGISAVIYFQGCKKRCYKCHNPELQDFSGGYDVSINFIINKLVNLVPYINSVAFQGGEPLEQKGGLLELLKECKKLGLETWLYSGYEYEEIPEEIKEWCDVIVAGEYMDSLKTGGFPASLNQRIIRKNKGGR